MPNGDPNWMKDEYPKLEEFFGRISDVLEKFTKEHNLKIVKYPHRNPSWHFQFRHPNGGVSQIEVYRHDDNSVEVLGCWWLDHYEPRRRELKYSERTIYELQKCSLKDILESFFNLIISWQRDDLDKSFDNPYAEKIPKEKFDKEIEKYPIPRIG